MEVYRCTNCGVISPLCDSDGKPFEKDRKCFHCGCTERALVKMPKYPPTKKGRRRRFGGGPMTHINLSVK